MKSRLSWFFPSLLLCLAGPGRAEVVVVPGGTSGAAVIERGAGTTTVRLSGPARLDWQRFQLQSGESLNYISEGGSHASLNVVRGPLPATIQGNLSADGPFYLLSPGGIQVGATGRISAPQVILSALGSDQADSLLSGGTAVFTKRGFGLVTVDGQISTPLGGSIVVMGPTVRIGPTASLQAPGGRVQVIAADPSPVSGDSKTGFSPAATAGGGSGLLSQDGTISARQVHLLSDGFLRNGGRLLSSGVGNEVRLSAPQIIHEIRPGDRSVISTSRLIVQGDFRQEGPVLNPDDGANPSPIAAVRQTPRLSQPGFITTVAPGQTQLSHAPLQSTVPNVSPIPTPARNPALVAARRGPDPPKKTPAKPVAGAVKKASFFGQTAQP